MDMYFSKAQRVDAGFTSQSDVPSQTVFSKVIIIDKRNSQVTPYIFSLSPETVIETDDLQTLKAGFISGFHDESFIPMGNMVSIDRKNKMIKLADNQLVSYEYLVVATHPKHLSTDDNVNEFFAGLATLVDALRIQKQQATLSNKKSEEVEDKTPAVFEKKCVHLSNKEDSISQSVYHGQSDNASDWFFDTDIRLYEVQV